MDLKTRRFIFYGFFLFFFLLSIGLIFYSQGWRFDFENFALQKTGAAYIETIPKSVIIKLNDEIIPDQSGLIKNGTLIPNLLPKNYKIEIQKDGYLTYRKNISVEPSIVSELINVILIPQKFEKNAVIEKLKGSEIIDLNAKRIIVKNPQNKTYYLYKFNEPVMALNINASFDNLFKKPEAIERAALHPFNEDRLIVKSVKGLYVFDARKFQIETIFQNKKDDKILAWTVANSNIYIIKSNLPTQAGLPAQASLSAQAETYAVYSYNLITKTEFELIPLPDKSSIITEMKISDAGSEIGFLSKSSSSMQTNNLSIFNLKEKKIRQIANNVKIFSFSPDNKKLFFIDDNNKINIYFIEDWNKNFKKKAGDTAIFDLKNKGLIKNAYWHKDSYNLFIEYIGENKNTFVDFMGIDDRPPLNQYPIIAEFENNHYNADQNLLYFTQNKTLYFVKI